MIRPLCFSLLLGSIALATACGGTANLGSRDDGGTQKPDTGISGCVREAYDHATCIDNCGEIVQGCTPTSSSDAGCAPAIYDPATCIDNCGEIAEGCTPTSTGDAGCTPGGYNPVTCIDNCGATVSGCTPSGSSADAGDASGNGACATPVLGAACTNMATPCSQPANPCGAGYIWSCSNGSGTWVQELIQCTESDKMTPRTTPCGADEVLFVDDAAGDPCTSGSGSGTGATVCGSGSYEYEQGCCYEATDAYCVPKPTSCGDGLTCGCAESICPTNCGGGGPNAGIYCGTAIDSVVDCYCGKA